MIAPNARRLFSILTPVHDPPEAAFRECIDSVFAQDYDHWEWCIVDDKSTAPWLTAVLDRLKRRDPRVNVVRRTNNGGTSAATNDALSVATGDFVVLLDHDDSLTSDALGALNHELCVDDTVDYIYSDEDRRRDGGSYVERFFKPTWSPERLLCHNYCSHISAFRRSLLIDVGGFRNAFDGAEDYDAVLRVTERARAIAHIPRVLYNWRTVAGSPAGTEDPSAGAHDGAEPDAKPYTADAGRRAVVDALRRREIAADVVDVGHGYHRVRRHVTDPPTVSIIVPTRGTAGRVWGLDIPYVVNMVDSLRLSTYQHVEVIVVYDTPTPADVLDAVKQLCPYPVQLIEYTEQFNFSIKCNMGALAAGGDVLIFLNDDIEVHSPDWIESMVALLQDDSVGLVGPMLLLDNFLIQSAGHISAPLSNFAFGLSPQSGGGAGRPLDVNREVSGVTGACLAIRRATFLEVGGFSAELPLNYNDVDLGFKILASGRRIIWTPDAQLFHFESKSRTVTAVSDAELQIVERLWSRFLKRDPYLPETAPIDGTG